MAVCLAHEEVPGASVGVGDGDRGGAFLGGVGGGGQGEDRGGFVGAG